MRGGTLCGPLDEAHARSAWMRHAEVVIVVARTFTARAGRIGHRNRGPVIIRCYHHASRRLWSSDRGQRRRDEVLVSTLRSAFAAPRRARRVFFIATMARYHVWSFAAAGARSHGGPQRAGLRENRRAARGEMLLTTLEPDAILLVYRFVQAERGVAVIPAQPSSRLSYLHRNLRPPDSVALASCRVVLPQIERRRCGQLGFPFGQDASGAPIHLRRSTIHAARALGT